MSLQQKILKLRLDALVAARHASFWQRAIDEHGEAKATAFYTHLGLNHLAVKSIDWEGLTLSRQPKDHERLLVKGIAQAQESSKATVTATLLTARTNLITIGLLAIKRLNPADYHELTLHVADSARADLRDDLIRIHRQGRMLVAAELSSKSTVISDDEFDALDLLTDLTTARLANDVQSRIVAAATRFSLLGLADIALNDAISNEITTGSVSYIDRAATGLANRVISIGRGDEAQSRQDEWVRVEYSALLDQNVCGPCAAADGEEASNEADLTPAPNPECEGGDWCRCFHVYINDLAKSYHLKYSDDQPREDNGRFAGGGGGEEDGSSESGAGSGDSSGGSGGSSGAAPRSFSSDIDGKQFISDHYSDWREGLSAKQDAALAFYQSPGYELMNGSLRGHSLSAPAADLTRAKEAIKNLDSAITKAPPLKESLLVHRGLSAEQFGALAKGDIVTDSGFTSVSLTPGSGTKGAATAVIELPPGMRAAAGRTKELILPRGTKFKVKSYKKNGKKVTYHFEIV